MRAFKPNFVNSSIVTKVNSSYCLATLVSSFSSFSSMMVWRWVHQPGAGPSDWILERKKHQIDISIKLNYIGNGKAKTEYFLGMQHYIHTFLIVTTKWRTVCQNRSTYGPCKREAQLTGMKYDFIDLDSVAKNISPESGTTCMSLNSVSASMLVYGAPYS